jgi:hypothetical protein
MTLQSIANILIIIVLVGFIGFRQMQWRPVDVAKMWRMPIVFGVIGLVTISTQSKSLSLTGLDLAVLVVEIVLSLAIGSVMGAIARFRPLARKDGHDSAEFESRTGWLGMALWVGLIVVRVGIDLWASSNGSAIGASTGVILLVLAANRIARTAVFGSRVAKLDSVRV